MNMALIRVLSGFLPHAFLTFLLYTLFVLLVHLAWCWPQFLVRTSLVAGKRSVFLFPLSLYEVCFLDYTCSSHPTIEYVHPFFQCGHQFHVLCYHWDRFVSISVVSIPSGLTPPYRSISCRIIVFLLTPSSWSKLDGWSLEAGGNGSRHISNTDGEVAPWRKPHPPTSDASEE